MRHDPAMPRCRALSLLLLLLAGPVGAQRPGLRDLPLAPPGRAVQFSSADPTGGNVDHGHVLATEDGWRILARVKGPGRLARLWSARPEGVLRLCRDGEVLYRGPFAALFEGGVAGFRPPLCAFLGGGATSWTPVPFHESFEAAVQATDALYHHVGLQLGEGTDRGTAADLLAGPRSRDRGRIVRRHDLEVRPGTTLIHLEGPAEITGLRLRTHRGGAALDRSVVVSVYADGATTPLLTTPVADLFGVGFAGEGIETQPVHSLGRWRVFALPMPCREHLRIVLDPLPGTGRPPRLDAEIAWRPLGADHDRRLLHGRFHRQRTVWGEPFPVLDTHGPGHLVGGFFTFAGAAAQGLTFLEGDERIEVDGEVAFAGTGTEDYFSGAWYFRTGTFGSPFAAVAHRDPERGLISAARWHVPDPVPFDERLVFTLEHGGGNDTPGADVAAMVLWYADTPRGIDVPAGERRSWGRRQIHPGTRRLRAARLWPDAVQDGAGVRLAGTVDWPFRGFPPPYRVTLRSAGRAVAPPRRFTDGAPRTLELDGPVTIDEVVIEPWLPAIRAWRVAGPFPGGDREGIDRVFGPKRDSGQDARYERAGGTVITWQRPETDTPSGYLDLNALHDGRDEAVAYAFTWVESPVAQDATLVLGSDDAVAVFLDGERIHRHAVLRGAGRDQDRVPLRLDAGRNALLIKVEDYHGGWGLFARIEDAGGLAFTPEDR